MCRSTSTQTGNPDQETLPSQPCHYSRAAGSFNPQRAAALSLDRLQQTTNCNCASARMEELKMPYQAALILAAALCLTVSRAVQADCHGHDLFPALKSEAPAAYAAIETAASAMPFRHGKLFRLSRAGSEPSYLFATLHLSDPRITSFSPRLTATLTNSKIVVLETVETGDVLRRAIRNNPAAWRRATLARENQRADNLLRTTDFKQLETLVARSGLPKSVAREFKASTLALLLDCLLARSVCPEQSPTLINSSPISHARTRSRPLVSN